MQRLFIYGTLAPGRSNHHVVRDIEGQWSKAWMRGVLHEEGWGACEGYPAFVPSKNGKGELVEGFLLSATSLDEHWKRLDAFEGDGYMRLIFTAVDESGAHFEAFVYAMASAV